MISRRLLLGCVGWAVLGNGAAWGQLVVERESGTYGFESAYPTPAVAAPKPEPLPPDAAEVVAAAERQIAEIERQAQEQINVHRRRLIEQLQAIQDNLTRAARLDEALVVRNRIRELSALGAEPDPGSLYALRGKLKEVVYYTVVGNQSGTVYGSGPYTDDSLLATAAVHAGVLRHGELGVVKVTVLDGQASYSASTANGVTSYSYGAWGGSYRVEAVGSITPAVAPVVAPVEHLAAPVSLSAYRGRPGHVLQVQVTGATSGYVWGTDLYTDDSDLGTAAVHAGALSAGETGFIEITIAGGEDSYLGSTRNGVTSRNYASWLGSFRLRRVVPAGATAPGGLPK